MARKREFDNQQVLRAATGVFIAYGYTGASVDQLVDATGLQRGSIYKAYSSKAGLFNACLREQVEALCSDQLEDTTQVIDLIITAMWEYRTAVDKEVAVLATQGIEYMQKKQHMNIANVFTERILTRAALPRTT